MIRFIYIYISSTYSNTVDPVCSISGFINDTGPCVLPCFHMSSSLMCTL